MSFVRGDALMRACQRCATTFRVDPRRGAKFCSSTCYHLGRREATAARTEKACSRCRVVKASTTDHFNADKTTSDRLKAHCRECNSADYQKWFMSHNYGVTFERYEEMFAAQGGVCAICRVAESAKDGRRLAIDHDHSCCPGGTSCGKCVRGLLCGRCNSAVGLFAEDADRMHRAIEYVLTR